MRNNNKIVGLINLLRFELPFAAGVCVIMGQIFALGKPAELFISITGFFSVFFISASILVLNDYFDIETDKINAPHRPLPSKFVTPNEALLFSILLLITGLMLSYFINPASFLIAAVLAGVGFFYNKYFKKSGTAGNLMVSFSVGMTFVFGGAAVGLPFNKTVLLFGLLAALIDLAEEIAADAMDIEGDKLINSNSLAIKYGKAAALKISYSIFQLVVILCLLPFLFGWFSFSYLIPILVMDVSIIYFSRKLINSKNDEGRKFIRYIYLGATFGLIIFVMMKVLSI